VVVRKGTAAFSGNPIKSLISALEPSVPATIEDQFRSSAVVASRRKRIRLILAATRVLRSMLGILLSSGAPCEKFASTSSKESEAFEKQLRYRISPAYNLVRSQNWQLTKAARLRHDGTSEFITRSTKQSRDNFVAEWRARRSRNNFG
jgi:hypothetical protein